MKTTWQKAWVYINSNHLGPAGALTTILGFYSPSEMSFQNRVWSVNHVRFSLAVQFHSGPLAFLAYPDDQSGGKVASSLAKWSQTMLHRSQKLLAARERLQNTGALRKRQFKRMTAK